MKKLIIAMLAISAVIGVMMLLNQPPPPPINYTAMAQPALTSAANAATDDDRLTAIIGATDAFAEIVRALENEADAQRALGELTKLADEAKRLDDELIQDPDARRALLERRQPEVQACATTLGDLLIATVFKIKVMTTIVEPLNTISSTLQQ